MTKKPFRELNRQDEFTDSFDNPRQTQRWRVIVSAVFSHTAQVLQSSINIWKVKAQNVVTKEEKFFYASPGNLVEIPKQ